MSNPQDTPKTFNGRLFWPDQIQLPQNKWCFNHSEIINKLYTINNKDDNSSTKVDKNNPLINEKKKVMEKCLLYFYQMKKKLNLMDHTYTAACIIYFRIWFVHGLPTSLFNCIQISQAILVTACKIMENNRPIDMYILSTCEFCFQFIPNLNVKYNMDKLKWEIKDNLIKNERKILILLGFDLNIDNPKIIIDNVFNSYHKFNRDLKLPQDFINKQFPKILNESRIFIVQAITQPISLLMNGYEFVILSLLFCGLQYKSNVDSNFKFPSNFFYDRFHNLILEPAKYVEFFNSYKLIEDSFFQLKSNKNNLLLINLDDINSIIDEPLNADDIKTHKEEGLNAQSNKLLEDSFIDAYKDFDNIILNDTDNYNDLRNGVVSQDLLDHTETKINELMNKIISESENKNKKL